MPLLSSNLPWELANNIWAQALNPLIANPTNSISVLENIALVSGTNIINHGLGRVMKGWFLVDLQANITAYRSAPLNKLTLTLTASGPGTVSIGVF